MMTETLVLDRQHVTWSLRQEEQLRLPVSRTSLIFLTAIADPRFRLLRPILLDVDRGQGGEYIVSNPHLHNYGVGKTLQAAVADYQSMLVDLYEELAASEAALSRHLRERLEYLRSLR